MIQTLGLVLENLKNIRVVFFELRELPCSL